MLCRHYSRFIEASAWIVTFRFHSFRFVEEFVDERIHRDMGNIFRHFLHHIHTYIRVDIISYWFHSRFQHLRPHHLFVIIISQIGAVCHLNLMRRRRETLKISWLEMTVERYIRRETSFMQQYSP